MNINHKIERVLNSCLTISQLIYGKIWCNRLITKYHSYRCGRDYPIYKSEKGKELGKLVHFIFKRERRRIENK